MAISEDSVQFLVDIEGIKCRPNDKSCTKKQFDALVKRQDGRKSELADMTLPMKKVSIFLDRWVLQNFKSEGSNTGEEWEKSQRAEKQNGKTLQDTGRLRASYLPFTTKRNAGIGSDLNYAKRHEEGLDGLPVRRMLPKKSEVLPDAKKIMQGHIDKVLK